MIFKASKQIFNGFFMSACSETPPRPRALAHPVFSIRNYWMQLYSFPMLIEGRESSFVESVFGTVPAYLNYLTQFLDPQTKSQIKTIYDHCHILVHTIPLWCTHVHHVRILTFINILLLIVAVFNRYIFAGKDGIHFFKKYI